MNVLQQLPSASAQSTEEDTIPVFIRWFGSWRVSVQRRAFDAAQLTETYDQAATSWDQTVNRLGMPSSYSSVLQQVLDEKTPLHRILDCGIGTGTLSLALSRLIPADTHIDGVDISSAMLHEAQRKLERTRLRTTLRQADTRQLPFDDNTFDMVMTAHMLEHLTDPMIALQEMSRVLKPGGRILVFVTRRSSLGVYVHLKWRTHRFAPTETETMLRNTGLIDVHCLRQNRGRWGRHLSVACTGIKRS